MKTLIFPIFFLIIIGVITPVVFAESVPNWVKNTAGWWATGAISEKEFINAIEFLIKDELIQVSISETTKNSNHVPEWVKNTAGWWATGAISEKEFINSIEFLIESGLISLTNSNCNSNEDKNKNKIPDEIENIPIMRDNPIIPTKTLFENKDWSNCIFTIDLSHYTFINVDFTNADFSNSNLLNTVFFASTFVGTDFSDSVLHGVSFVDSELTNVNFDNTDFTVNTLEQPFIFFTYSHSPDYSELEVHFSCSFVPCRYHNYPFFVDTTDNQMYEATFGKNSFPVNLKYVDSVDDMSDQRTTWRLISDFTQSRIENSSFHNSNLSEVRFHQTKMTDLDFSNSNMYNTEILHSELFNVKTQEKIYDSVTENILFDKERTINPYHIDFNIKNFQNPKNFDLEIKFKKALDEIPINWSMDMIVFDQKLFIADTDNHRIVTYDINTFEKLDFFTSPFQNFCKGKNSFTSIKDDCPNELRNLPTSLEILDEKIFVSYGFQNEIQVFNLSQNFLYKFGETGDQVGQFISPFRISTSENELFIADSKNQRIQVFDDKGIFLRQFSTMISSLDSYPYDLDVYKNKIFVIDNYTSSVLIFDNMGNFLTEFPVNKNFSNLDISGIDVHDDLIFISDSENNIIHILDLEGNLILEFGKFGSKYGEFNSPMKVIVDGNKIYVSDAYNYRIQVFEFIR